MLYIFSFITRFLTLLNQNTQRKVKKPQYARVRYSRKPGTEKAMNFAVGMNITLPSYQFAE